MSFGAVGLALAGVQAISQIGQGRAQQAESNYNASLVQGQADLIDVKKGIEFGQYQRQKGQYLSKSTVSVAGSNIALSGSAVAAMVNAQTQINIDQAIGQFNLQQEKNYTLAQAEQIRRKGNQKARTGYSNAFSTILSGVSNYAQYSGGFDNPLRLATNTPRGVGRYIPPR